MTQNFVGAPKLDVNINTLMMSHNFGVTEALVVTKLDGQFELQEIRLPPLQPDEALVEIQAFGICHTDISCALGKLPCRPNAVLGHEGAGVILRVGSDIRHVGDGDNVLLSFSYCGSCSWCTSGHPAYCYDFNKRNFGGKRPDGSAAMFLREDSGTNIPLYSSFFGQSSFARRTVVHRSSITKVAPDAPLDILAPLGCGIQTGVGVILNSLQVRRGSSIAVFGIGSVGSAALMASKLCGAKTIIAVDINPSRLTLAKKLGATHTIIGSDENIVQEVARTSPPAGVDFAVDCTGVPSVIEKMVACLGMRGRAATVGAPGGDASVPINIMSHLTYGKEYVGCSEGDSNPAEFIPKLINIYQAGQLPLEKIIHHYPIQEYKRAMNDVQMGRVVKAVIKWS